MRGDPLAIKSLDRLVSVFLDSPELLCRAGYGIQSPMDRGVAKPKF